MAYRARQKSPKRITVTVDPDDYDALNRLAEDSDVSISWLIRRLMREFRERQKREGGVAIAIGEPRRSRREVSRVG